MAASHKCTAVAHAGGRGTGQFLSDDELIG
jgi:hypothetical protein